MKKTVKKKQCPEFESLYELKIKGKKATELKLALMNLGLAYKTIYENAVGKERLFYSPIWMAEGDIIDALNNVRTWLKAHENGG